MSSNWPKRIGCHASQIDPLDGNLEGNTPARRPQTVAIRHCDGNQQTDVNREHIMVNSYRSAQLVRASKVQQRELPAITRKSPMSQIGWQLGSMVGSTIISLVFTAALASDFHENELPVQVHDPQIGQAFNVPYRLTDTNHFLVRVRINGKGPFNFLVDSGAPACSLQPRPPRKLA